MANALVPEFAVRDWIVSRRFYCEVLGFRCLHERPEEGFSYLALGGAEIMIDQIGRGRTFDDGFAPDTYPSGRGLNVQIRVPAIAPLLRALSGEGVALFLRPEERWYRAGDCDVGHLQFVVADPDGYLLRFHENLGTRKSQGVAIVG